MSTTTPRLGLTLPIPSESMALGDGQLSENYVRVDEGVGVSTGTAFPSVVFTGRIFRRTDQNKTYYYDGSTWIEWGAASTPLINGIMAAASNNTTAGPTGTTEALAISTSFAAVQNRRYLIKARLFLDWAATASFEGFVRATLRWNTGSVPTGASALIKEDVGFMPMGTEAIGLGMTITGELAYTAANATIHIGLLFRSESANTVEHFGTSDNTKLIHVYDYGAV